MMTVKEASEGNPWRVPTFSPPLVMTAAQIGAQWSWGLKLGGIDKLWEKTKGEGVKWAILDTGIDSSHPDFAGRIVALNDFTGSGFGTDDRVGHGTHAAGTIGAGDSGSGVAGVAPQVKLIVGKVLGDDGSGATSWIAAGVDWAVAQGCDGISLSLTSPSGDPVLEAALRRAVAAGKFVVGAAGNDGPRADSVGYPGKWEDLTLTVGAVDETGALAEFSSRGPQVDCCAPGVKILSCWPGGGYAYLSGTSMATPFVAGAICLMISYRRKQGLPPISNQAALELEIGKNSLHVGGVDRVPDWGFGIFNPEAILATAPTLPALGRPVTFGPFEFAGINWVLTGTPKT